ncbi:aldo/keto reductase [Sphingobium scionense]
MTWGSQNSEAEAHAQLDYAIGQGVNFIDTAEMYPVTPVSRETQGLTEAYIGSWIAGRKKRDDIILATKVAGPARDPSRGIRAADRLDRRNIEQAIDDSLRRLQTDYIDLYQVHWPDRRSLLRRARPVRPGRPARHRADRGNARCPCRSGEGGQDPPCRRVERNPLGRQRISAPGAGPGPAPHRLDPERL